MGGPMGLSCFDDRRAHMEWTHPHNDGSSYWPLAAAKCRRFAQERLA